MNTKKNCAIVSIVSPDFDVTTQADFFKSIFCNKPCIDDESTFSTKKTRGLVAFIKILSINETSVLPPRLEPPVPKNNTFSNFLSFSEN